MSGDKRFLDRVYDYDANQTAGLYNEWAASYDQEIKEAGYQTPGRCAQALAARIDPAKSGPTLDLGCGTGLSGLALRSSGFETVDGVDFSEGMLEKARALGCYRATYQADLREPLFNQIPEPRPPYAHAMAAGVLHSNHAPASVIWDIVQILPNGGLFAFSLNDETLKDRSYSARLNEVIDAGGAELVFKEYGEHLPGHGLKAMVYVLKRR